MPSPLTSLPARPTVTQPNALEPLSARREARGDVGQTTWGAKKRARWCPKIHAPLDLRFLHFSWMIRSIKAGGCYEGSRHRQRADGRVITHSPPSFHSSPRSSSPVRCYAAPCCQGETAIKAGSLSFASSRPLAHQHVLFAAFLCDAAARRLSWSTHAPASPCASSNGPLLSFCGRRISATTAAGHVRLSYAATTSAASACDQGVNVWYHGGRGHHSYDGRLEEVEPRLKAEGDA